MTLDQIKAEAESFFEWPEGSHKLTVAYHSAMLFARHIADLAVQAEQAKRVKVAEVQLRDGYCFHKFEPALLTKPDGTYSLYINESH